MITKKELMLRIIDIELANIDIEERLYELELMHRPKKSTKTTKSSKKVLKKWNYEIRIRVMLVICL